MGNYNSGRPRQDVCQRGHKMSGENLIINKRKNGKVERECRECKNMRQRKGWNRAKRSEG